VLGIQENGSLVPNPGPETPLRVGDVLFAIGQPAQLRTFAELFGG
jgi:K+/H+ antiporter YhaU regulatory subunit KhtT